MIRAHRDYHPADFRRAEHRRLKSAPKAVKMPRSADHLELDFGHQQVKLTNLKKLFWPELKITKRDLIQYYADVSSVLLPHLKDRAMVMKRYPNGAASDFFFMNEAPSPPPPWIHNFAIQHGSGNNVHLPRLQALPSLLCGINIG